MPADEYTHSPTPEEIMEYLDREGSVSSRIAIEDHLARCAVCQAIASEQRRLSEAAQGWQVEPPPLSLQAPAVPPARRVAARVLAWHPAWLSSSVTRVAAAMLLAVVVSVVWNGYGRHAASPTEQGADVGTASSTASSAKRVMSTSMPDQPAVSEERMAQLADQAPPSTPASDSQTPSRRPAVIRTAVLRIVAKDFAGVRLAVESIVAAAGGFVDQMTVAVDAGTARALRGTLRVPSDRLADVTDQLRRLGQVVEDTQSSEDVSDQLIDLGARLASARATERRLTELLRDGTGKLSDVLDVERELARVRLNIERLDAETAAVGRRVSYASVSIDISEERKAGIESGPLSLASRFRIAAADGLESALESAAWALLLLLLLGPALMLWAVVFGAGWLMFRLAVRFSKRDSR